MPATKKKETEAPVLYDAGAEQTIPITLTKSGKTFHLAHECQPLSDDRYFEMEAEAEAIVAKLKRLSTDIYAPKERLWDDIVISRTGYKERSDWKEATHQADKVAIVNALLHTQILSDEDADITTNDILFDDEALTPITFNAMFSGTLITGLTHSFRPETKADMNEFLSIQADEPLPNQIASAVKLTKSEKLCRLGRKLLKERSGYAEGSEIPAWHLAATTESYLARQIGRMGKSLAA